MHVWAMALPAAFLWLINTIKEDLESEASFLFCDLLISLITQSLLSSIVQEVMDRMGQTRDEFETLEGGS